MATRSFCVGLPVVLDVNDDGTVVVSVDLSEAADAVLEEHLISDRVTALIEDAVAKSRTNYATLAKRHLTFTIN